MAVLYDRATGEYINVTPDQTKFLAQKFPELQAQTAVNGVGSVIAVRGVAGQKAALKAGKFDFCEKGSNFGVGCFNMLSVTYLPAGTVIGTYTGETSSSYGYTTEGIRLDVKVGSYPAGTIGWVYQSQITPVANTSGAFFPIQKGSVNSKVADLQSKLVQCGYFRVGWTPDSDWGDYTQQLMAAFGKTRFDSQSELDAFTALDCSVIRQKISGQGGGGNTSGGGGNDKPIDIPITTTPATDNTAMWIGVAVLGGLAIKNMGKKKKKKKKGGER
jgi:hypothetical protein